MRLVGRDVPVVIDQDRVRPAASEVMALVSDNRAAQELCGWRPRVSLEDGLRHCIDFVSKHRAMYNPAEYQR
jgi:nucleoside-diphosphate-sugar epimerase